MRRVKRWWFTPAPPARLAVLRVLIGSYSLLYVHRRREMLRRVAAGEPALFAPVGIVASLDRPVSPTVMRLVLDATEAANVAFILGWRHRFTGPLYGASLLALLSYRNSWSMIYHNDNVLVLHAIVLGVAPAADVLSLDALSRNKRRRRSERLRADERYGWPIQLMNSVCALTYLLAAIAKLKGPLGREWASGNALRGQIAVDGLRKELLGEGATAMSYRLYGQTRLFQVLASGSLAVEALAPAALADRRAARVWALNALAMHWGIFALMGIKFRYQMSGLAFAPFFAVERTIGLLSRAARLLTARP